MAEKSFEFKFSIGAILMGNFSAAFGSANKELAKLNTQINKNQKEIEKLMKSQKKSGTAAEEYSQKIAELKQQTAELENKQKSLLGQESKLASTFGKAAVAFGTAKGFAGAVNSLFNLTQYAIKFESSMADVKKVVDFDTPEQFKAMSKDVLDLSTRIPMAADGLAQIVAAGGQSGIARNELISFAESAAKMGVAFDITADQAGDMMAKWRTAFRMNQSEVVQLADKINFLGNTTAASAPLISDVVTRIGPLGSVGGVASGEIAALGASMVGAGINSEIAATGIKNMILSLVSGSGATKSQAGAFAELGLDAVEMAEYMQKDAKNAILMVLHSIQQIDKARQASVMTALFGKESLGAIAPLLSNLKGLEENFNKVADATRYTGSMEAEFAARADTAENSLILMNNRIDAAKTSIAQGLLPVVTPLAESIGQFAILVGDVASKSPVLTQVILTGTVALMAFGAAGSFAQSLFYGGKWIIQGAKALNLFSGVAQIAGMVTRGLALAQLAFNTVLAACPMGWLIIGVTALTVAGVELYRNWDTVKNFFATIWDNPTLAMQQFCDGVKNLLGGIADWVSETWESVKSLLSAPFSGTVDMSVSGFQPGTMPDIAENASGGIYGKGAFLTTFAEKSGESAIPHTPNRRNVGLLAQTNAIMGNPLGGGNITATFAPQITVQGGASDTATQIDTIMAQKMREFEEMLKRIAAQQRRLSYA